MGFLKTAVRNWLGLSHENRKPASDLNVPEGTFMNGITPYADKLNEFWLWYTADAQKLTQYYANMLSVKAKQDYFYAKTAYEENKKTHSGLPRALIDTLVNVTGIPDVTASINDIDNQEIIDEANERMEEIVDFNDLKSIIKQDSRPKTLAIGGGAFFVSNLSDRDSALDKPVIEFVDERFCEIETIGNIFVAASKKTVYHYENKKYVHTERRSYNLITNNLYDTEKKRSVPLETIPDTAGLEEEINLNIDAIPAVPARYKNGYETYGLSIFEGKLDLFDDYDQTTSQLAELIRKSTPVEYMPAELMRKNKAGEAIAPTVYDRKYIMLQRSNHQDDKNKIEIKQPQLNFASLIEAGTDQLIKIFNGVISPASIGMNIAADASGESVRERERVTFVTRGDIIDNESGIIKRVLELALKIYDYMEGKEIKDYDVHVDYPEYSAPTFDKLAKTLLPMWAQNRISPERYVYNLYGDDLTEEDRQREIDFLKEKREQINDVSLFGGENNLFGDHDDDENDNETESENKEKESGGDDD